MSHTPLAETDREDAVLVPLAARPGDDGPPVDLTTFFDVSLDLLCIRELDGTVAGLLPGIKAVTG